MELVGYRRSRKEIRDVYHSVYLLRRSPRSLSCGESRRRRAIQDILSSLQTRLQRKTYSAEAEDLGAHGGEWVWSDPPQSYEVALWAACQKALETAEALQSDLERLNDECRGRSQVCSQSKSQPRTWSGSRCRNWSRNCSRNCSRAHSRGWSRGWVRGCSQSHSHPDPQSVRSPSLDKPPTRRVNFWNPKNEDLAAEVRNPLAKPSVNNLETWLDYQAGQLGTPHVVEGIGSCYWYCWPAYVCSKKEHHFGLGCSWKKGIPCLWPPRVWIERPTSQTDSFIRT